jgi:hypothetical protein
MGRSEVVKLVPRWVGGWIYVQAVVRIAYNNKKYVVLAKIKNCHGIQRVLFD